MTSNQFSKFMHRNSNDFEGVLNSLRYSSCADNSVGGLDEALLQFAEKKAMSVRRRRGPIEGILDEPLDGEQLEIAEDAMLSAQVLDDDTKLLNLPSSAPNDVPCLIKRMDILSDSVSRSAPDTGIQRPRRKQSKSYLPSTGKQPLSSKTQQFSHLRFRRRRPRTTSPSNTADRTSSVYLKPSDIMAQPFVALPLSSDASKAFRSTYPNGNLRMKKRFESTTEKPDSEMASSLPNIHEGENGSLRFKCSVPNNEICSKNLTSMDQDKINNFLEFETRPFIMPPLASPPKRPTKPPKSKNSRPAVIPIFPHLSESPASPFITTDPATDTVSSPIPTKSVSGSSSRPPQQNEDSNKSSRPLRRRRTPSFHNKMIDETSKLTNISEAHEEKPRRPNSRVKQEAVLNGTQYSDCSESSNSMLFGLITEDLLTLFKRRSLLVFTVFSVTVFFLWYFSVCLFISGALLGGGGVYVFMRFWAFTMRYLNTYSPDYHPEDCFLTRGSVGGIAFGTTSPNATCCSLHNSFLSHWRPAYAGPLILPRLRDLQPPPVPHLSDEDPKTGPTGGNLGEGLGFKLDKNSKPLYQAWMNEIVSYSSETYHINDTHSVFVTLEGTQLRIQRPRKNVPRRAMFNVPVPSSSGVQFVHQRIYNMRKVTVSLLPDGLVAKRLWSKKYPICLTIQSEQNSRTQDKPERTTSILHNKHAPSTISRSDCNSSVTSTGLSPTSVNQDDSKSMGLDSQSSYSITTSRYLRVSTNPSVCSPTSNSSDKNVSTSKFDDALSQSKDGFLLVQPSDLDDKIFLFARTCREKETWFRRLYGASIGKPLLLTTQQAFAQLESCNPPRIKPIPSEPQIRASASFNDIAAASNKVSGIATRETQVANSTHPSGSSVSNLGDTYSPLTSPSMEAYYDPDFQLTYLKYMAKFIPAQWLSRSIQALKLNLNFIKTDPQLLWFNALLGRMAWDLLKHNRWKKKVQEKIQAKIKKMKFVSLLNEPVVTSVEMGNEFPVITNVGRPYLDNQGLWLESELVYTGGFTLSIQTTVNAKKLEKVARQNGSTNATTTSSTSNLSSTVPGTPPPTALESSSRSLAAFLSDEEDSADSSTDSERETTLTKAFASLLSNSNPPTDSAASTSNNISNAPSSSTTPSYKLPADTEEPENIPTGASSKGRFHRIFDKITRSLYVQMADSKLVQYSLDLVTQTTLHLKLEVTMLHGTLVVNIPPPPSNRLWYGFRGNPNLRLKVKPKVGDYLFNFPRILEAIEKRIITEFQRVVVLPNMDDLVLPMLFPEENLESPNASESKFEISQTDDTPIPPQHLLLHKTQATPENSEKRDTASSSRANTPN